MNSKSVSTGSLLLVLAAHLDPSSAVCFYPGSDKSGYKVPLKTEVRTAEAIIVGRVLSDHGLHEDADDPDGITASSVQIEVLKKLKGNLPGVIVVRNENTSSRYPMAVGEEHILFLSRTGDETWIDSCGNSEVLANGVQLVSKIQTQLRGKN